MDSILNIDKERNQLYQLTQRLFHNVLHDYIAQANRRDVIDSLYEFFDKAEVALIPKQQLKIYQAMEATILDRGMMTVKTPVQPNGE